MTLRRAFAAGLLATIVLASSAPVRTQGVVGLFEQYLESLRRQAGIPGLSAAIVSGGRVVWERGFGYADVDRSIAARPDTPYPIGGVTQALASVLALRCTEEGELDLAAPVRTWAREFADGGATVRQVLSHTSSGSFRYDPGAFATLTPVVDTCAEKPYRQALTSEILDFLAMRRSVPGYDLSRRDAAAREMFSDGALDRYEGVLEELATPYRVDGKGNATPTRVPNVGVDASTGLISTVRDLARFDAELSLLLRGSTLDAAFSPVTGSAPFGLGWFVQYYRGHKIVWQYGEYRDAYSSLYLKVPDRDLTLILLANSDGLSSGFSLSNGDVGASLFARIFLGAYL